MGTSKEFFTIKKSGDGDEYDTTSLGTVFPAFGVLPESVGERGTLAKRKVLYSGRKEEFPEVRLWGAFFNQLKEDGMDGGWPTSVPFSRWHSRDPIG